MSESTVYQYQDLPVHIRVTGQGSPLLILHGWGSSSRVMMPVAEQLKEIRTCYVMDLPGFGDTPEPGRPWSISDYTDLVQSYINDTFTDKVDLLVHSFGGRITLKLCARPFGADRINKVVITGGAGMKPKRSAGYYIRKYTAKALKAPFMLLPTGLRDRSLEWLRSTSIWKKLGSGDYSKLSGVMRETFVLSVTEHLEGCLPLIPHDILLIWGRNDDATPVYQGKRIEEGLQKSGIVVIEDAGHYAFLDKPKQFAAISRAYLQA